ncbi:MAG: hypothetical protein ACO1SV_15740 [Fimbriimonas sp.]
MKTFNLKWLAVGVLVLGSVAAMAQDGGGRQRRGGGGFGQRGGQQGGGQILYRAEVQTELGLSDEQKTKLTELRQSQRGNRQRGGGGNREEMQARRAEQQKKLAEILTPDQVKRLKEIQLQLAGPQAIANSETQKELGLDAAQIKKIEDLQKTYREAMQSVREKTRNGDLDREKAAAAQKTNNDALRAELQKVLTAAQAEKLKSMGGKPFKLSETGR